MSPTRSAGEVEVAPAEMALPPNLETEDGRRRMIGVEIEFAGLSCVEASETVRELFGGRIRQIDPYRFEIEATRFGAFAVELDTHYAHPSQDDGRSGGSSWGDIGRTVRDGLTTAIGAVTSLWLPVEIVTPPVPLTDLPELDRLIPALRSRGAEDTRDGLIYAFATQFNPEAPSLRAESVLDHLRAFLLLGDALRAEIDVDPLRRALPFADPFPAHYVRKVVDPDYRPALPQLIDDYLDANPSRNRELDLLPLFAHVAPEQVWARVEDTRIKGRPTFHYRLPDTRLSDERWSLITEWNRWVEVEHLAADPATLRQFSVASLAQGGGENPRPAAELIEAWRAGRASGR